MDLQLTAEEISFRDEVRAFLKQELTPETWARHRDLGEQGMWAPAFTKAFRRKLGEKGYLGIAWPREYGGGGRSQILQAILWDEMEYHRAPGIDRSVTYVPNAIIAFGSDALKAEFMPQMCRGELSWFVGYSEPEAGSDLANITTRAIADGDDFIITGQKAFSSDAHMADWGWVAARTDPTLGKHRGLTMFAVDMTSPGVTVAKYPTMAGWTHHAVHFDNVRVPRSRIVGGLDQGWSVVMGAIDFERTALAASGLVDSQFDRLLGWALQDREAAGRPIDEPDICDKLVDLAIEAEGARLMFHWIASQRDRGLRPQHETSLALLVKREAVRRCDHAGMDLLGPFAPLRPGSVWTQFGGELEVEYRDHTYYQFAAGGFDITRNVVATRGLGLPR